MLLDEAHLVRTQPPIEEIVQPAERLFAVAAVQFGHWAASCAELFTIPLSSATCQSDFCSILRPR